MTYETYIRASDIVAKIGIIARDLDTIRRLRKSPQICIRDDGDSGVIVYNDQIKDYLVSLQSDLTIEKVKLEKELEQI